MASSITATASAASVDPTATQAQKDEASFFGAAALLAVVADPSSSTAAAGTLETFGSLLDAYGLGGSALDRAHLDTIRFVDCTASGCTLKTFPPNSPNSRDVQAFLLLKAGGALQGVAAAVALEAIRIYEEEDIPARVRRRAHIGEQPHAAEEAALDFHLYGLVVTDVPYHVHEEKE